MDIKSVLSNIKLFIICFWNTFFLPVFKRFDVMFLDQHAGFKQWSSAKVGVFFCLYPACTFAYILDAIDHGFDPVNTGVFALAIAAPRTLSQLFATRFGGSSHTVNEKSSEGSINSLPEENSATKKRRTLEIPEERGGKG